MIRAWMLPLVALLALPLLPAGIAAWAHPRAPEWRLPELAEGELRLGEVQAWPAESYLWVDARAASAYGQGHIPGAVNLNESDWDNLLFASLERLASGKRLVVYCDSRQCDASKAVRKRLLAEGYATQVYVLHGGWQTWEEAGGEVAP